MSTQTARQSMQNLEKRNICWKAVGLAERKCTWKTTCSQYMYLQQDTGKRTGGQGALHHVQCTLYVQP